MAAPLARLRAEFAAHPPYQNIPLELQSILSPSTEGADTEQDARASFRAIYRAVLEAKRAGYTVHLSIVGGQKILAVYGMAAAQLLFDDDDALWYVLAGGAFFNEERWHPAPGDEAQLVRVPVLRWGTLSPALTDLRQIEDPFEAVERQQALLLAERLEEARAFVLGTLSGAERRVLELLVREGLGNIEIAERLSLSPRTVERHLGEISGRAGVKWGLENVSRAQLIALLNFYYVTRSAGDGNGEDGGKYA